MESLLILNVTLMNTTLNISELAEEYLKFQKFNHDTGDLKDHVRRYESLMIKAEEAGISFYDLSVYARRYTT